MYPLFRERFISWLVCLQVIEDELRERIERLETRQATDDASLLILNRYWNQVNKFRRGSKNKNDLFNITVLSPNCDVLLSPLV